MASTPLQHREPIGFAQSLVKSVLEKRESSLPTAIRRTSMSLVGNAVPIVKGLDTNSILNALNRARTYFKNNFMNDLVL